MTSTDPTTSLSPNDFSHLSPSTSSSTSSKGKGKSPKPVPISAPVVPLALSAERLENFGYLRQLEGLFSESVKTGAQLSGTFGVGRLQELLGRLFRPLQRTAPSAPSLVQEGLLVFHVDPDEVDFSRCSRIQEKLEDLAHFTFWRTERCPPPSLDYECTLLHGSQVWFGKKFILLGSQLALPDTISREEMPALLEVFAHASGALRLPPSSGSSQAAPVLPSAQETATTITTMADMMAEIRALRALVQMPPATSVPVLPAGMPMFSMAQIEDMSRIFGPGGGGGMGGAGFAGPTTINVPPAQSESKRAELAKVLAVRPCFSQARFNQVWLVTDHDLNGRPAAFSLSHATEVMRDIVTDLHGQYATQTTDAFLHNAVLLL